MDRMKEKLQQYMDAGFPLIYVDTFEEDKATRLIVSAAGGMRVTEWTERGYFGLEEGVWVNYESDISLPALLSRLAETPEDLEGSVLILKDAAAFMDQPEVKALLKHFALLVNRGRDGGGIDELTMVIISPVIKLPRELEEFVTILHTDYLDINDITSVIDAFCAEQQVTVNPEVRSRLAQAFKGLSEFEIRNILALALSDDGQISMDDLHLIFDQKQQVIAKSGILEMVPLKEKPEDIGGLENLKRWMVKKKGIFENVEKARAFGVDMPKGVLIAGMPGCGKSLNAKAAASLFHVPLLRMDMGRLMGKYVGESEANMRRAIRQAEAISPCVLWIDELEKAFAGIGGAGGAADVTTRLFGTFLTWLQEKTSLAFVVATANKIEKLPPELLRKGRFDEIFYVDLPNRKERRKIFEIHIGKRRKQDLPSINLDSLVNASDGFSGADIEGVVKDAVETAFNDGRRSITTDDILQAMKETSPLSEVMKDSISSMRNTFTRNHFKKASEDE